MSVNITRIFFALLVVLAVLYAANIYFTKSVSSVLIEKPARLSFAIIESPKEKCEECFDAGTIIKMIDTAHNIKYKTSNILYDSTLSKKYIEMYEIKNLPAVVVSGDIESENVVSAWKVLAGEKRSGRIVIENLLPYYDIESNEVKGVVSAILIKDETCEECFDENQYISVLGRFGLVFGDTVVYDITSREGEEFVKKYGIIKVPALILSPDAGIYTSLTSTWGEVGTVEEDGWFVFREVQKLNPQYKSI